MKKNIYNELNKVSLLGFRVLVVGILLFLWFGVQGVSSQDNATNCDSTFIINYTPLLGTGTVKNDIDSRGINGKRGWIKWAEQARFTDVKNMVHGECAIRYPDDEEEDERTTCEARVQEIIYCTNTNNFFSFNKLIDFLKEHLFTWRTWVALNFGPSNSVCSELLKERAEELEIQTSTAIFAGTIESCHNTCGAGSNKNESSLVVGETLTVCVNKEVEKLASRISCDMLPSCNQIESETCSLQQTLRVRCREACDPIRTNITLYYQCVSPFYFDTDTVNSFFEDNLRLFNIDSIRTVLKIPEFPYKNNTDACNRAKTTITAQQRLVDKHCPKKVNKKDNPNYNKGVCDTATDALLVGHEGEKEHCVNEIPLNTFGPQENGLQKILNALFSLLFGIAGTLLTIQFAYTGIRILSATAIGNVPEMKARKEDLYSAIKHILILLLSYIILNTVNPELLNLNLSIHDATKRTTE